jgi:galactonate dehydratase
VLYCGGISEMRKIAAWADAYSILVAPHNSQGPVTTAASAHVARSIPNLKIVEVFDDFMPAFVKAAVPGCPDVRTSEIAFDERPGLGIELDHAVIAEHPYEPIHFDLWGEGWERRFNG